ncbi:MAG TPA: ACT domain-containing protein [Chitinispirillaceae bacterium]|nr:ACT domain-containing protein [Chitinispirillaceae bacterium]
MIIKQLSVFLENRSGKLAEVTESLTKENINITALSVADTSEYGILRLVVSDPDRAAALLKSDGFSVGLTNVICIIMPDKPGALARALRLLSDNGLCIEYMYAFSMNEKASAILRVEKLDDAIRILSENEIHLLKASELYSI